MKLLVAATLASLIEAGTAAAVPEAPVVPFPSQTRTPEAGQYQPHQIQGGRWRLRGKWFRHRQWRCREDRCRWHYW